MITDDQADKVGDSLLDQPRKELGAKQYKRARLALAEQRRRESPVIPALVGAVSAIVALEYLDNVLVSVLLGAAIGGLFGWAARRS